MFASEQGTKKKLLVVAVASLALTPLFADFVNPAAYTGGRSRDQAAAEKRNTSAVALMFGEMRTTMSDMLFLKTERYLHGGVAYEPHLTVDEMEEAGKEEGPVHHGVSTLIRDQESDFRGIVGELQRQVHPWEDPSLGHTHTEGTELLPWYRVMTLADPHNIRGYTVGGHWLKDRDPQEAIRFLEEGIEKNPEAFQIYSKLASVYLAEAIKLRAPIKKAAGYFENGEQPPVDIFGENEKVIITLDEYNQTVSEQKDYMQRATENFDTAAEKGIRQRPEGWMYEENQYDLDWNHYAEEDLRGSLRLTVQLKERYEGEQAALERALKYNEAIGGDPLLKRYINEFQEALGQND